MSAKILLADDHALFRGGVRSLLEEEADLKVVGEAEDGDTVIVKPGEYASLAPSTLAEQPYNFTWKLPGVKGGRPFPGRLPAACRLVPGARLGPPSRASGLPRRPAGLLPTGVRRGLRGWPGSPGAGRDPLGAAPQLGAG